MLLIVVSNVASIFTEVYMAKMTSIHSLPLNFLHIVTVISFPSWSRCGDFHGRFHLQLSQVSCTVELLPFS